MRHEPACRRFVLALGLLAGLALAGCGSTGVADDLPTEPAAREKALADRLEQIDPRTGLEGSARFLELTLSNPRSKRVACRCAPDWFDAKGAVLPAGRAWRDVDLRGGETVRLRFAPMPAEARSWRLRFEG